MTTIGTTSIQTAPNLVTRRWRGTQSDTRWHPAVYFQLSLLWLKRVIASRWLRIVRPSSRRAFAEVVVAPGRLPD
jgi:hypothetical protein